MSATQDVETFRVGEAVRVRAEAKSSFSGRVGVVVSLGAFLGESYFVTVGTAQKLWFLREELERV
jgi:hypothetical protein